MIKIKNRTGKLSKKMTCKTFVLVAAAFLSIPIAAVKAEATSEHGRPEYAVKPGDVLQISVWKEADLQQEVLVRPDSRFSFPLVGELDAAEKPARQIQEEVAALLDKFIPDPVVTVGLARISGNKVYVIGKVNRPGEFILNSNVDVVQALSMAGGMTPFAALKDIIILRRVDGVSSAIPFNYADIERGENLAQNIVLRAGDVVVVP